MSLEHVYLQYSRFSIVRSGWGRPSWFWAAIGSRLWWHWCCCRCTPANRASSPCRWRWSSGWRQRKPPRWPAAFEPRGHTKPWRFILVHTLTGPTWTHRSASGRGSSGHTCLDASTPFAPQLKVSPHREREKKWKYCLRRSPDAQNQLFADAVDVDVRGHQLWPLQRLHTGSKRAGQHDSSIVLLNQNT